MLRNKNKGFTLIELLVVITITFLLAMPLLALRGQSRERTWQNRCTTNLRIIYAAMIEYANDNDDSVVPTVIWAQETWTWPMLLKPYVHGGDDIYYRHSGGWTFYEYMLFYCPTRHAMGQSWSNYGFYTNYCPNINVMVVFAPLFPVIPKFEDFQDHDNIALLLESPGHVLSTLYPDDLDYVHYDRTHVLMLNGTVKRFKMQDILPVKLRD